MTKFQDDEREDSKIKAIINIKRFLLFHKKRIKLLKKLYNEENDERLIFQISILGLESLARVLYPNETSKSRFIKLLSKEMKKKEAIRFYDFCRCPLVHEGFSNPFSLLECWDEGNIGFIYPHNKYLDANMMGSVEYPSETVIIIYEELIYYTENFFKKKNIKDRILKGITVYGLPIKKTKLLLPKKSTKNEVLNI